jgi:hypothetical protein
MESIYFWAERPALSLLVLWLLSVVFLWAAREPMLQVLRGLGKSLEGGLRSVVSWCRANADELQRHSRETLLAAGELELQHRMEREFQRIDQGFSEKVGQYSTLHRRLDDLLLRLDADYSKCGDSPPEVPGWSGAVEAVAAVPTTGDPNVHKVLEGIRGSMRDAEKRALKKYRDDTGTRHRILSRMRPDWKEIQALLFRMKDCVAKVLQTTAKIDRYVDDYGRILKDRESAAHALTYSAVKPFVISLVVLAVALGGAFINFQLIALPMSELVPAGARIGGLPVSTVSALVIVLMEVAVGIFIMDMLGITDLFPKLAILAPSRRRAILGLALAGLFFLAAVESSLAILREQIVEAEAALKLSLAGPEHRVVVAPTTSSIPVVGQAVLGFVLPWILAMVAIPLEMLLDSGRHVCAGLIVLVLRGTANAVQVVAHAMHWVTIAVPNLYDVYIAIPLRIEQGIRAAGAEGRPRRVAAAEPAVAEQPVGEAEVA